MCHCFSSKGVSGCFHLLSFQPTTRLNTMAQTMMTDTGILHKNSKGQERVMITCTCALQGCMRQHQCHIKACTPQCSQSSLSIANHHNDVFNRDIPELCDSRVAVSGCVCHFHVLHLCVLCVKMRGTLALSQHVTSVSLNCQAAWSFKQVSPSWLNKGLMSGQADL